jgi:hypothetical protein
LDSDYASGIVQEYSGLVISERFTQEIIGNIKIGSSINDVVGLLGEPSAKEGDYLFYKTNKAYIAFKGTDKVETSILAPIPKSYDKEILNKLLSVFGTKDAKDLLSVLQEDNNINEFFEVNGHIHGGGWYADSDNGISVDDFDEFTITVYNNFEGNLYKPNDILIYENKDYMFEKLRRGLEGYYIINEEFKDAGVLSPNGKYNSIYEWNTSDSHYFIIRTMDYSRPDFPIGAPAGEYKWINDDYLLYLDAYSTLPFAIRASEDSESQAINIFYATGLIKTNDSTEGMGINDIEIADIKDNMIQLKDKENGKEYQFQYTVRADGGLEFKYLNN